MPIAAPFRRFYTGIDWRLARERILRRAGGTFSRGRYNGDAKCERCQRPDRTTVWAAMWTAGDGSRVMIWAPKDGVPHWTDCGGKYYDGEILGSIHESPVQLGVAHLDHNPENRSDDNLAALCRWCHLHHDAAKHKDTRCIRKDGARPLLAVAS